MLKSMTGFGRGEDTVNGQYIVFEIKSVKGMKFIIIKAACLKKAKKIRERGSFGLDSRGTGREHSAHSSPAGWKL